MASGKLVSIESCSPSPLGSSTKSWLTVYTLCCDTGVVEKWCIDSNEAIAMFNNFWEEEGYTPMPAGEAHDLGCRLGIKLEEGKQTITVDSIRAHQNWRESMGLPRLMDV